ncbi:unnamed protein product, partial [Mesorhabditis spiculigera]
MMQLLEEVLKNAPDFSDESFNSESQDVDFSNIDFNQLLMPAGGVEFNNGSSTPMPPESSTSAMPPEQKPDTFSENGSITSGSGKTHPRGEAYLAERRRKLCEKSMRQRAAKRNRETPEQREQRLEIQREQWRARRLAIRIQETPEERQARLKIERERERARRHERESMETPEEREERLRVKRERVRAIKQARQSQESPEERQQRLLLNREQWRAWRQRKLETEAAEDREARLLKDRTRKQRGTPSRSSRSPTGALEMAGLLNLAEIPGILELEAQANAMQLLFGSGVPGEIFTPPPKNETPESEDDGLVYEDDDGDQPMGGESSQTCSAALDVQQPSSSQCFQ